MTELLHPEEQTEEARKWFNIIGEEPEVMAKFFVPRIRSLQSFNSPQVFSYLSQPSIGWRILTAFTRRNRLVDEHTGERVKH